MCRGGDPQVVPSIVGTDQEYRYFEPVLRVLCRFSVCHGALRLVLRESRADVVVLDIAGFAKFEAFYSTCGAEEWT